MGLSVLTDINSYITPAMAVAPQSLSASGTVTPSGAVGIDRTGTSADQEYLSGVIELSLGAATGSPTGISVVATLYSSPDNSTWTAVSSPQAYTVTGTAASTIYTVGFGLKSQPRYLQVGLAATLTGGSSPTILAGANIILGGAQKLPTP